MYIIFMHLKVGEEKKYKPFHQKIASQVKKKEKYFLFCCDMRGGGGGS
jgi:hypothetical protein